MLKHKIGVMDSTAEVYWLEAGEKVYVYINKTARSKGILVEGRIVSVGARFSLVQLKNYKETFWNEEVFPCKPGGDG